MNSSSRPLTIIVGQSVGRRESLIGSALPLLAPCLALLLTGCDRAAVATALTSDAAFAAMTVVGAVGVVGVVLATAREVHRHWDRCADDSLVHAGHAMRSTEPGYVEAHAAECRRLSAQIPRRLLPRYLVRASIRAQAARAKAVAP